MNRAATPVEELSLSELLDRHRVSELKVEAARRALPARIADYHVLEAYDRARRGRYGDMSHARRGRELNRLADELIAAGVPVDRDGEFPASTDAELADAFERVARPRIRRLERETSDWVAADGTTYARRTKYNGTSLEVWRALERRIARAGS